MWELLAGSLRITEYIILNVGSLRRPACFHSERTCKDVCSSCCMTLRTNSALRHFQNQFDFTLFSIVGRGQKHFQASHQRNHSPTDLMTGLPKACEFNLSIMVRLDKRTFCALVQFWRPSKVWRVWFWNNERSCFMCWHTSCFSRSCLNTNRTLA